MHTCRRRLRVKSRASLRRHQETRLFTHAKSGASSRTKSQAAHSPVLGAAHHEGGRRPEARSDEVSRRVLVPPFATSVPDMAMFLDRRTLGQYRKWPRICTAVRYGSTGHTRSSSGTAIHHV
eukprot:1442060-Rhodomonas_salina.1